jgi:hypothetical protein
MEKKPLTVVVMDKRWEQVMIWWANAHDAAEFEYQELAGEILEQQLQHKTEQIIMFYILLNSH